ncbi:hypothetical protein ACOSQ3_021261 [Xanthoceras sorbifolium]
MNEFFKLVQGSMIVDAYEKKFTELSRAAPHIVENEVNRCKKFEEGLRHEIKTYSALRVERNINEAHRFDQQRQKHCNQDWLVRGSSSKLPRAESYSRQTTSFQEKYMSDSSQASVKQPVGGSQQSGNVGRIRYPPCQKCGKNHKGQCNLGIPRCYHYGQTGHFKRDCPGLVQISNVEQLQVPRNVSSGSCSDASTKSFSEKWIYSS